MPARKDVPSFLSKFPRFEDTMLSLQYGPRMPGPIVDECKKAIAMARKFNDEVVRPLSLAVNRKTHEDHGHIAHDPVKKGNEWGFYTMWIPKLFGGRGYAMPSAAYVGEEIASACDGFANVLMAHYLGNAGLAASCNAPLINRISREVAEGERTGKHEDKTGQRAACADDLILFDAEKLGRYSNKTTRELVQRIIDHVVCISRPCIDSFGTGVARGAFKQAPNSTADTMLDGKPMIRHSRARRKLADTYKNVLAVQVRELACEAVNDGAQVPAA